MLRALIFDFDGVIVDSEPLILKLTQQMAAFEGWRLTPEEYYRDYLALDDRGIVEHLYHSHGLPVNPARRAELVEWKAQAYGEAIRAGLPAMPGALDFVRHCAGRYPLAIASGSLREEVETLLEKLSLLERFSVLATAEDCERSKPDPAVYLMALKRLRTLDGFQTSSLQASECLAIEDAPLGVDAAHAAGMKCLALTHSRPAAELCHAEWVFQSFAEINPERIEDNCERLV
ncbi:MAG: HAD family hydrolase [Terriglobia bacterium]